jgi:hypothetical protein
MEINLNTDLLRRIRTARQLMRESLAASPASDPRTFDMKRKNLADLLQEIGILVVLHYSPLTDKEERK